MPIKLVGRHIVNGSNIIGFSLRKITVKILWFCEVYAPYIVWLALPCVGIFYDFKAAYDRHWAFAVRGYFAVFKLGNGPVKNVTAL